MTPIIDVHAHVFNARDIPIKGYLLSRARKTLAERLLSWAIVPLIAACVRKNGTGLGPCCSRVLDFVSLAMGGQYGAWAHTLCQRVVDVTAELVYTYPQADLWIPLMIDFEYWFPNSPDTDIQDQIEHIAEHVILPYQGRIHPFVPFDPARELVYRKGLQSPDGGPEKHSSLALVRDAIEHKGFIGVKLYNSLGYKPFNNAEVDEKRRQIWLHRKMGYADALTGDDYDEVLCELYDYCVENEVPITAHCVMDGIESYPGASFDFCAASFWREVLQQERYQSLRVNLAHLGWSLAYGYNGPQSWAPDVSRMLTEFEHLYADVAHHYVLDERDRLQFIEGFVQMRAEAGARWPQIKQKILFGIDWHVIKRARGYADFQDAYTQVVTEGGAYTPHDVKEFLGGNALRFLGLEPGGQNRRRLTAFYQKHGIAPPPWF